MNKFNTGKTAAAIVAITLFLQTKALAWGARGHDSICQAATYLLKEKNLQSFLKPKMSELGHLCNIPDTSWRSLKAEQTDLGNPTHFVDFEVLGLSFKDIPLDIKKIIQDFTGKENASKPGKKLDNVHKEFGSAWWRANQFVGLAASSGKAGKFFDMYTHMGLMGHYVGDLSNPMHSTVDYDGWMSGHGGFHRYYEEEIVVLMDEKLVVEVMAKAKSLANSKEMKAIFATENVIDKMKMHSELALKDLQPLFKLDKVTKKSEQSKTADGVEIKTPAERAPADKMLTTFKPYIIKHMARSALILSHLWDLSYEKAGKPDLKAYKGREYSFSPDFVAPDYL